MLRARRSVSQVLLTAALLAWAPGVSAAGPDEAAGADLDLDLERALISLEAQAFALQEVNQPDPRMVVELQMQRARLSTRQDPGVTAALLNLAIEAGLPREELVPALLDAGRAEAALGHRLAALQHFREALAAARQGHAIAAAFEGFVRVAEQSVVVPELPAVDKYIQAISHRGVADAVGWDTVYRLGRLLARRGDPRAIEVVKAIPADVPAGRRALYIQATSHLRQGNKTEAQALFLQAAELPPYPAIDGAEPERDDHVRELSWLAVGRLALDAGDTAAGYFAYQQVPVQSPRFLEAFFELGWLALQMGEEELAEAAFSPVVALDERNHVGRKAQLVRGYLMLKRREYDAAIAHYDGLAARFTELLGRFDSAVATVQPLGDLARECDARHRAENDPLLAPVLARPEVEAARKMGEEVETLRDMAFALDKQRAEVDALLAGEGPHNPFKQIVSDREAVQKVLHQVHDLVTRLGPTASISGEGWKPCCTEPRKRARSVRNALEAVLAQLEHRENKLRTELVALRTHLQDLAREQSELYQRLEAEVRQEQLAAVQAAVAQERAELRMLAMEGEAGSLQALWSMKEEGRDAILALEQERKTRLDKMVESLEELGSDR